MKKFFTFLSIGIFIVIIYLVFFNNTENNFGETSGITVEFEESQNKEPIQIKSEKDIEYIQQTLNNIKWGRPIEIEFESPPNYVLKDEESTFDIRISNDSTFEIFDRVEGRLGLIPEEAHEELLNIIDP